MSSTSIWDYIECLMISKSSLFRSLPNFNKLKALHVPSCAYEHLKLLFLEASFASKLSGMRVKLISCRRCSVPIFSSELEVHIHTITIWLGHTTPSALIEAVIKLPALKTLHIILTEWQSQETVRNMLVLFKWLGSPNCPVTALAIEGIASSQHFRIILGVLSKIPMLEVIHLHFSKRFRRLRYLFKVLLKAPRLESVSVQAEAFQKESLDKIFEFQQRHDKPLEFTLKSNLGICSRSEKIHFVSSIYQTLHRFQRSRRLDSSFPLSAWANVLEKMGTSTFDCPSTEARAVGLETLFNTLQELFGDTLRFVNHAELHHKMDVVQLHCRTAGERTSQETQAILNNHKFRVEKLCSK